MGILGFLWVVWLDFCCNRVVWGYGIYWVEVFVEIVIDVLWGMFVVVAFILVAFFGVILMAIFQVSE